MEANLIRTEVTHRKRHNRFNWLLLIAALILLGSYVGYARYEDYIQIDMLERKQLDNQALVIERNLVPQIAAIRRTTDGIVEDLPSWKRLGDGKNLMTHRLQLISGSLVGAKDVLVIDAQGMVVASSNKAFANLNLEEHDYFKAALNDHKPQTLYVSPPFKTAQNEYVMALYRTMQDQNRDFAGIVAIHVDLNFFQVLLGSVLHTPDASSLIALGDGQLLLVEPTQSNLQGSDLATPGTPFSGHLDLGQRESLFTDVTYPAGEERMVSFRTIQSTELVMDKALVVATSRNKKAVFAAWYREANTEGVLFVLLAFVTVLGMTIYQRRQNAFDSYLQSQELIRKQNEEERRIAAIAFESQAGMVIADAAGAILRTNQAFTRLTGYSAAEAIGHTPGALLKSGRHDMLFYQRLWGTLRGKGHWQGEMWNKRKNGSIYAELLTITAVKALDGEISHYVGTFSDITQSKETEAEIHRLAYYDQLTQLPNRRLLQDRLGQATATSARSGLYGAILFIDLDNFKVLNDTRGHDVGDQLLQQVALRLTACVREGDTVARLGGDEFVLMLAELSRNVDAAATLTETVGEKILYALNQPYQLTGHEHQNTPSIGATLFCGQLLSSDELLKQADLAMYQSKASGRNTLRFFDQEMQTIVHRRAALEADLREAITQRQFTLYYQGQVVDNGRLTGAEVLVRWQHPVRGVVSPAEFIPMAEETGLILPLGHWILKAACEQLAVWATRTETAHLTIAVNISARQFQHDEFVEQVLTELHCFGTNPHRLKLELTESLMVSNVEGIIHKMMTLKTHGVRFSLDDFGTGYSSLAYLKRLPLDQLKIDQGFVKDILTEPNDAAIAKMVIVLAQSLGIAVIAEGVEIEAQKHFLARQGCHAYQGYLFGRPMPVDEFERYVGEGARH